MALASQAKQMVDCLLPFRCLLAPIPCNLVPPFLTKERLKLCWEQAMPE